MHIGIYSNIFKDADLSVTNNVLKCLQEHGFKTSVYNEISTESKAETAFNEEKAKSLDMLFTIGGDGTILRVVQLCSRFDIPILGINLGRVGFLTEVEKDKLNNVIMALKGENYIIEERMMLKIESNGQEFFALNDAVVCRRLTTKMISVNININDSFVDKYNCDGFIVSTPTGSTAYSLSAGGPVISPTTKAIALTPVNSHSLHSRPIVVCDNETIKIHLCNGQKDTLLVIDGESALSDPSDVVVSKAERTAKFIRFKDYNFFAKLLSKLNTWSFTQEN